MLVCKQGLLQPAASALAELCTRKTDLEPLRPGTNAWVIDTGSGYNLVARHNVDNAQHIIRAKTPLTLLTANGVTESHEYVVVNIPVLNIRTEAWILENTPLVLSVNKLVRDHGCEFAWKRPHVAQLQRGSKRIALQVAQGVPVLRV